MAWTAESVAALKKAWAENLSASQAADAIHVETGQCFTRNAVIGKVHRLGLEKRGEGARAPIKRPVRKVGHVFVRMKPKPVKPVAVPEKPVTGGVSLLDIASGQCRYPHNDPRDVAAFRFCGEPVQDSSPYCPYHHLLCYDAVAKKAYQERLEKRKREKAYREPNRAFV